MAPGETVLLYALGTRDIRVLLSHYVPVIAPAASNCSPWTLPGSGWLTVQRTARSTTRRAPPHKHPARVTKENPHHHATTCRHSLSVSNGDDHRIAMIELQAWRRHLRPHPSYRDSTPIWPLVCGCRPDQRPLDLSCSTTTRKPIRHGIRFPQPAAELHSAIVTEPVSFSVPNLVTRANRPHSNTQHRRMPSIISADARRDPAHEPLLCVELAA